MNSVKEREPLLESRRERKRRETRVRIAETAMALFKEKGFAAVTVDEIAEAADISKPTFFNYFSAKDDVVLAWQDKFSGRLADAVAQRPKTESLAQAVEEAMIAALASTASPESFAITALIRNTPALAARNQAKYLRLEGALAEALRAWAPAEDMLRIKIVAMMAIGSLRIGTEDWQASEVPPANLTASARRMFSVVWTTIGRLSHPATR